MQETRGTTSQRLDSWKEIAEYLGCDVRTAMRWEKNAGLPLHRVPGGGRRGVFALVEELESWRSNPEQQLSSQPKFYPLPDKLRFRVSWRFAATLAALVVLTLVAVRLQSKLRGDEKLIFHLPSESLRFTKIIISIPEGGTGLILAKDFNGDGLPDLVIGGAPMGKLTILWNRNHGTFSAPIYLNGCHGSFNPIGGDFDGDGNLDLAVACSESGTVEIWWGDGKGRFASPIRVPVGRAPLHLAAGDVNRDGLDDIIAGSDVGPLVLLTGHRNRSLTSTFLQMDRQPFAPLVEDLNKDGYPDIAVLCVTCHAVWVFLNRGDGTFGAPAKLPVAPAAWQIAFADVTGDRVPDLVSSSINGSVEALTGHPNGTFESARSYFQEDTPMVFPFGKEERKLLLVLESWKGYIRFARPLLNMRVEISEKQFLAENLLWPAIGDFNGDGLTDIAIPTADGGVSRVTVLLQQPR